MKNPKKKTQKNLYKYLNQIKNEGVGLYINHCYASPSEISNKVVNESCDYMADYILDDIGVLKEVYYNKVH